MVIRHITTIALAATFAFGGVQLAMAEGHVKGTVKWDGKTPKRKKAKIAAEPYCQRFHGDKPLLTESPVVVNPNGTLKYVFLHVKSGLPAGQNWPVPAEPVVLDQVGCSYVPHVFGIRVGQELLVRNSDDTSHNVNCSPKLNTGFNQGQPKKGMELKKSFDNAEMMVPFKCDVHPWMSAFGAVMEHPFFAVTNENGEFEIKDLPAGEYVIEAWHENTRLPDQETTVVVADGETASAEFTFARPKKKKMSAAGMEILHDDIVVVSELPPCPGHHAGKKGCCKK